MSDVPQSIIDALNLVQNDFDAQGQALTSKGQTDAALASAQAAAAQAINDLEAAETKTVNDETALIALIQQTYGPQVVSQVRSALNRHVLRRGPNVGISWPSVLAIVMQILQALQPLVK